MNDLTTAQLLRLRRHLQTATFNIHQRELLLQDCIAELFARGITEATIAEYDNRLDIRPGRRNR